MPVEIPRAGQILTSPRHWAPAIDAVMVRGLCTIRMKLLFWLSGMIQLTDKRKFSAMPFLFSVSYSKDPRIVKETIFCNGRFKWNSKSVELEGVLERGICLVAEAPESEPGKVGWS